MKESLFSRINGTFKYLIKHKASESRADSDRALKIVTSLVFAGASLLLTILNIVKFEDSKLVMTISTSILVVGFIIVTILTLLLDKRSKVPTILMCLLVALIFSLFVVYGGNDGFACLWVLIVPPIAMNIIGLIPGLGLTVYYQLFLIAIFYTPLKDIIPGAKVTMYTGTFGLRFPLLYLTIAVASFVFTMQKEYYFLLTEKMAFEDKLTSLHNRAYYEDTRKKIEDNNKYNNLSVISVDLNRLKFYNDVYGHEAGDQRLIATAKVLSDTFINADAICRIGGDEFNVITHQPFEIVDEQINQLRKSAKEYKDGIMDELTISVGVGRYDPINSNNFQTISVLADKAMYEDKRCFYEKNHIDRRK